jgi:hypothetical protein
MRSSWWADALGPALVGLTEGAWITVVYALIETVGRAPFSLGLPIFAAVAFLGALAGPRLEKLGDSRWQVMSVVALGLGVLGMLVAPGVLSSLAAGDLGAAFGAQPGGWLVGVAAFRGMLGGATLDDPDRATRPIVRGVLGLSLVWLYAGLLSDASQAAFRAEALGPTLLFIAAGIAAAGLRRVQAISISTGIRWWRNRAWLVILGALLIGLTLLAIPIGRTMATIEPQTLGLAGFPELLVLIAVVALILAPNGGPRRPSRLTARGAIVLTIVLVAVFALYNILHNQNQGGPAGATGTGGTGSNEGNGMFGVVIVVVVLAAAGLLVIVLARNWRRAGRSALAWEFTDQADFEISAPGSGWLARVRQRLFRLRPERRPVTAEAAYLATLKELEPLPFHRRLDVETPAGHARRLHVEGSGTLELDLLAANYQLSRWGRRHLPERETRRAIGRWERSRVRIAGWLAAEHAQQVHAEGSKPADQP